MSHPTHSAVNACSRYPAWSPQPQHLNVPSAAALPTNLMTSGLVPVQPTLSAVPAQSSPSGNPVHNPLAAAVNSLGATTPNAPPAAIVIPAAPAQAPVEDVDDIEDNNLEDEEEEDHVDLHSKVVEFRRVIAAQKREISELHAKGVVNIPSVAFLDDVPDDSIPRPAKRASYRLQSSMGLEGNRKIYLAMRAVVRGCMSHCAENYKTVWLKQDREYVMTVINVARNCCPEFRRYQGGWPIEVMMSTSGKYKRRADSVKAADPLGLKQKKQAKARLQAKAAELVREGGLEALGIAGLAGPVPQAVGIQVNQEVTGGVEVNQVNEEHTGILVGEAACTEEAPANEELPPHLSLGHVAQPTLHHIHSPCPAPYFFPTPGLQPALPLLHHVAPEPASFPTPASHLASPTPQFNINHTLLPAYIENHDWHSIQHHAQLHNPCAETTINDACPPAHDNSPILINVSNLAQVPAGDILPQVNTFMPPIDNAPAIVEGGRMLRSRAHATTTSAGPPAKKTRMEKKAAAGAAGQENTIGQEGEGGQAEGKAKAKAKGRAKGRK
ncbi:hypothetical protein BJ165DRAFT_1407916 [Panaeolus papilionaceus]|nr:hypothetical protein BJ165DRAFT_1407916 [Panaeolus papilionaceus]